jgi:hypothetical protein
MLETNEQTNRWEKKESGPIILDRLLKGAYSQARSHYEKMTYKYVKIPIFYRLGVVACSCDPATWKPELVDGVRAGVLATKTFSNQTKLKALIK